MMGDASDAHLSRQMVSDYWHSVSSSLARLFDAMQEREYWIDSSEDADFLVGVFEQLSERFEEKGFVDSLDDAEKTAVLAQLYSFASMPLFVRMLVIIDGKKSGVVSRLAHAMAKVSGEYEVFVTLYFERMEVVLQAGMRGQIFSAERIKQVAKTLKYIQEGSL